MRAALAARTPVTVTWWGEQWSQHNHLSADPAPAAFKGFAQTLSATPPACGSTWTSGPGNSPAPPATVPPYMAVIVTGKITKAGSTVRGDTVGIVVVKTQAGYAPDPGHPGLGTIVAVLCQSPEQGQQQKPDGSKSHPEDFPVIQPPARLGPRRSLLS